MKRNNRGNETHLQVIEIDQKVAKGIICEGIFVPALELEENARIFLNEWDQVGLVPVGHERLLDHLRLGYALVA